MPDETNQPEEYKPEREVHNSIEPVVLTFLQGLMKHYLGPLHNYVKENPGLIQTMPGFLLNHDKLIVYVGRTHIAVEYLGSEVINELPPEGNIPVEYGDYTTSSNLLEKIVGFEYDSTSKLILPLPTITVDLILPTNRGFDKLGELKWNFAAQNMVMGLNARPPEPAEGEFARIINALFFDADESGLKTRHIKWLDFIPISFDSSDDEVDSISFNLTPMRQLVERDAKYSYPLPDDYKFEHLPKINRFIEIWGNAENSETEITSFLAKGENEFILTMRFGAKSAHPELTCEWQSEHRDDIRPDFFILQPNGYADIVEFKLPHIDKKIIVGDPNRESFGAWLNSYVSQTRVYSTYFDDPNNRKWFENKYGFKVHKPRRWLVVGRRSHFDSNVWREIVADYKELEIMTFDDLIDGVVAQFYK